ncbi:hypothetical protein FEM48_Zijuj02G0122100 [Ziziphus jujuba var. spinosa]|uniref:Uncharacterized protein n=1 Tax=Ziziphus jujuba var. spinosa TaxID=714518 RepID=A0A978VVN5_ZIZJJ|nr:hypothetical protein FEM48_Zijuj02G0122100 [Ziziphus jujuba var. spinosa]
MATETVVSYPTSTIDEQVEKKVEEVEKAIDHDNISSSKEKGEENSKVEDSSSPAPTTIQSEGVEDKQIEQPLVVEVPKATVAPESDAPISESQSFSSVKVNEEEKPKDESLPSPATSLPVSGATEDRPIEPPAVDVEKAADAPVLVESHSTVSSTKENEEEKPKAEDKLIESPVVEAEKASADSVSEVPVVKSHSLCSTKENEEEKSKADDVPTLATPSHEPEDTKENVIEPPVVEAEKAAADASVLVVEHVSATSSSKESGEEASTEAENSQTTKTISLDSGGAEEKQVEPHVVEIEKRVDAPISDVPIVHETTTEKDIDSTTTSGPELVDDSVNNQTEVKTTSVDVVEEAPKQPSVDIGEKVQEEQPKIVDVHESSVETSDKLKETLEPSPVQVESEASAVAKEIEDSKLGTTVAEKPENEVAEVEEKPAGEQSELTEQVEKKGENVDTKESEEDKTTKDEKTLADKVEDSISLRVDETDKDAPPNPTVSSEVSTDQTAQSNPKDEGNSSLPSVAETVIEEEEKKETSKVDVVEKISKDISLETGKVGEENAAEKGNVITEDSTQPSILKDEAADDSSLKKEDRDAEPQEENKIAAEQIKDGETPTSAETKKDENVEEVTSAVNKPVEESQQPEEEVKKEETVKTEAKELEKVQNPETPTKEDDLTKTSQDQPKEVPAKPTQKQSNNLISKVKHSLVKAKKAIIGKSPNSKTPASEPKGDIKVK